MVTDALARANVSLSAVDAIAVALGPGSFTGLRVGLSLAKGLVFGSERRLVGVATLEALAAVADAPLGASVCAALDARKREVYAAFFTRHAAGLHRLGPDRALSPQRLLAELRPGMVLVGDAPDVYPELCTASALVRSFAAYHPRGSTVAYLGWERLRAGQADDVGRLVPVYVRAAEAELAAARSR